MKVSIMMLAVVTAGLAIAECPDLKPEQFWNREELYKTPPYRVNPYPESDYPGLQAMLIEGKGPENTKAEFFAYYGKPSTKPPKGGYPGLVMVHGGGGTAFPDCVQRFVKQGFAVIALDWYNQRPAPGLTNVPPSETTVPRVALKGGWRNNKLVVPANIVLSHSLLRSFPEVNKDRTCYMGLSWGSWYGSVVTSIDDRFQGGVMIYLCDRKPGATDDPKKDNFVMGPFHKSIKVPLWWIVWPNDGNGTPGTMQAGWDTCPAKNYAGNTIVHNLGHSHAGFWYPGVDRMAQYFVGMGPRLPFLSRGTQQGDVVKAEILDEGKGIDHALLFYSEDPTANEAKSVKKCEWKSVPAEIRGKVISAKLPAGWKVAYLGAYEKVQPDTHRQSVCGSSGFFIAK